jgi:hypothetical protein
MTEALDGIVVGDRIVMMTSVHPIGATRSVCMRCS